jgi:hypothetical protein
MHSCPILMSQQIIIPENDSELMSQSVQRKYCVVISVFSTGRPRRRPQRRPPIGRAIRPNSRTQQTSWKKSEKKPTREGHHRECCGFCGSSDRSIHHTLPALTFARPFGPKHTHAPSLESYGHKFPAGQTVCAPQEATTATRRFQRGHAK